MTVSTKTITCPSCRHQWPAPALTGFTKEHVGRKAIHVVNGNCLFEGTIVDLTADGQWVKISRPGFWGLIAEWHQQEYVRLVETCGVQS